jgi:putative SOS response-associated peptidase YedK
MCGRYRRKSDKQRIAEVFKVNVGLEELDLGPDEDVAPGSMQPVVTVTQDGERQLELMRWGFKLPERLLFNARSEGIETAKFWKDSFQERRCIVPADAIYEWQQPEGAGKKLKYEIVVSGQEPFGMAGLWKLWKNPKTLLWERTFAVITGEPNEVMRPIHDRMTTFLGPRDYAEYLAGSERPPLHLLRILPAADVRAMPMEKSDTSNRQASLFE